jgi:thiol:disulfide interchange protein DsbD
LKQCFNALFLLKSGAIYGDNKGNPHMLTNRILKLLILVLAFSSSAIAEDIPKELMKLNIQLVEKDGQKLIAANFRNHPKWHTYWINPGDAGLPIEAKFNFSGKEEKLETLEWPIPKRYIEKGDILTFGYSGDYTLFYKLPDSIKDGDFNVHFKWLICKHICIPGEKNISGKLSQNKLAVKNDFEIKPDTISSRYLDLPKEQKLPDYFDLSLIKYNQSLALIYTIKKSPLYLSRKDNLLTPFVVEPFSYRRETLYKDKNLHIYGKYTIDWDGEFLEPEVPLPTDGKFKKPYTLRFLVNDPISGKHYIASKTFKSFDINGQKNFDSLFAILKEVPMDKGDANYDKKDQTAQAKSQDKTKSLGASINSKLLYFIVMAFLGGLILNIMPCVLPVISLKLFGLIRHSNEDKKSIMKHNLAYSLGVMVTFLLLAGVVVALKSTGEQVGWGFQLQSPTFVALMAFIIFIMSLNLFGLFEFRTPGGSKLGNVELRDTFTGDFFGGVLATILSTPCSAPFLGTALTFAFSESLFTIFSIFMFIGLGLASPFILTAFFPALIRFLPKPGMWMEHVKKFLGLTLVLTTLWLLDVFMALTESSTALLKINTALALVFFIIYMRSKITKNIIISILFFIPTVLLFTQAIEKKPLVESQGSGLIQDKQREGLPWQKWSEDKMKTLQDSKKLTFIDFTAKWCITCKVNEKLVLDTKSFSNLVKERDINLLLGDWTKRDPVIGKWLKSQGFVGVPAYFVINTQGELIKLGETITLGELKRVLK